MRAGNLGLYVSQSRAASGSTRTMGKQSSWLWYLFAGILLIAFVEAFLSQPHGAAAASA